MLAIAAVAGTVVVVLVAIGLAPGGRGGPFPNLFSAPRDEWPQGVQEDDAPGWRWSAERPPERQDADEFATGTRPVRRATRSR